ncbi:hypothetical protein V8C86DRAFT_2520236 [Haematococcus lacustris]
MLQVKTSSRSIASPAKPFAKMACFTPARLPSTQMPFLGGSSGLKRAPAATRAGVSRASAVTVNARQTKTKGAGQQVQVEVDKPLGLKLAQSNAEGGGVVVTGVSGNAAKAGIKTGDTIIYTSSFFGDELWPADKLSFVNSACTAAPSPITIVYVRGENTSINVKRLPKKPAPPKFGRKLTDGQRARATHVCVDCGYIYSDELPFNETKESYRCPQCQAPKRRFVPYDVRSGQAKGIAEGTVGTVATLVGGLIGIAVLAYLASSV